MMDARGVLNMYSIPAVVNKHNTARVASCWFIIHYRLVMHGNVNIKEEKIIVTVIHSVEIRPANYCVCFSVVEMNRVLNREEQHPFAYTS